MSFDGNRRGQSIAEGAMFRTHSKSTLYHFKIDISQSASA
jgi:hypothetical protein